MKARRQVAVSALIAAAVLTLASLHDTPKHPGGLPPTKQLIAYGFVFFMLSALADFGVEAAGAFAILAMVSIILEQGDDALAFVGARAGLR